MMLTHRQLFKSCRNCETFDQAHHCFTVEKSIYSGENIHSGEKYPHFVSQWRKVFTVEKNIHSGYRYSQRIKVFTFCFAVETLRGRWMRRTGKKIGDYYPRNHKNPHNHKNPCDLVNSQNCKIFVSQNPQIIIHQPQPANHAE